MASMNQGRSRRCLAPASATQLRLLGCCKPVPHPIQRLPQKHLSRPGVVRLLCSLKTVLGMVLAQLNLE
jgi:hypothetical protein